MVEELDDGPAEGLGELEPLLPRVPDRGRHVDLDGVQGGEGVVRGAHHLVKPGAAEVTLLHSAVVTI